MKRNFEFLPQSYLTGPQSWSAKIGNFRYFFPIFSEVLDDEALNFCTKILFNTANVTQKSNFKNIENWNFGRILNFEILVLTCHMIKFYLLPQFLSKLNDTWHTSRQQLWLKKIGSGILNFCLSQIWRAPKVVVSKLAIFATFSPFSQRFWMIRPSFLVQRCFLTLLMLPWSQIWKILKIEFSRIVLNIKI